MLMAAITLLRPLTALISVNRVLAIDAISIDTVNMGNDLGWTAPVHLYRVQPLCRMKAPESQ
jgi:hypothetical protein